ncbi:MAG: hypothetical protein NTW87_01820 [Planctomycetota bacterium]|nr:hypothetical protein [Planctomycetota bacterium]
MGCIAALEGVMRLIPEERLLPAKSRQGEIFFMEREVLPRFTQPRIVLLGSSRARRAVVPRLLDERLGLPADSTLNVGLASGRVFEALYLYERNRAVLRQAELVILNVDEWYLSSGWRLGSLYEMHAPWDERFAFSGNLRSRLVLDGLFTMRLKLRLLPAALAGRHKKDVLALKLDENNQVLPPPRKPLPADVDPRVFRDDIATFYHRFEISPVLAGHVEKLARMVKEDGGRFVLMQLPNRAAYQVEVGKLHGAEYLQHVAALDELARNLDVPLCLLQLPSECGLTDASYEDYGHINPEGAKVFTAVLGDLIRREHWLER